MNVNTELAQALLAGWIAGAIAGLASTALVMILVVRSAAVAARAPWSGRLPILGIVLANALTFGLTLVGLLLGVAFYHADGDEAPVLFALFVAGGSAALGGLYVFVRAGVRRGEAIVVLGCLAAAGLSFAVALPLLGSIEQ